MWTTSKMKIDTCDIDQESFMRIKAFIQKFQLADTGNVCDSRLLIQLDSMHLCIGTNNCISDLGSNLERNDMNTIYLIKWKIGYYNLYEKEDLKDIPEIKLFGIPRDYKHYVSDCNKPKKEFMMKVLRYKSKCCRIF
uniref:Uncharacterized protein n=1 Tax=Prevotella sp. GTC17253 TaxID=3236793 RepID=A0AB33IRC3_9BACT